LPENPLPEAPAHNYAIVVPGSVMERPESKLRIR
jgi:hypothetical protein